MACVVGRWLAALVAAGVLAGLAPPAAMAAGPITGLPTSEVGIVGRFERGPVNVALKVGAADFDALFASGDPGAWPAEMQARRFFGNGGVAIHVARVDPAVELADSLVGSSSALTGVHALTPFSELGIVIVPELSVLDGAAFPGVVTRVHDWVRSRQAFLIIDPPSGLGSAAAAAMWADSALPQPLERAALYFPYLEVSDGDGIVRIGASGSMAAIVARSDATGGIWKSPAGTGLPIAAEGIHPVLTTADGDLLNTKHVNAIRSFAGIGIVPWGARTRDSVSPENRLIAPVRLGAWIRESIVRGLAFTAAEDNGAVLWAAVRTVVEGFMNDLFRQGALAGSKPEEAYFVRCDLTTMTAADIADGRVNVIIGFAPVRPAEFTILRVTVASWLPGREMPEVVPVLQFIPGGARVVHATWPGQAFAVETKDGLGAGGWLQIAPPAAGDGGWRRTSVLAGGERAFFRVPVVPLR